jgi:hypothetical protein
MIRVVIVMIALGLSNTAFAGILVVETQPRFPVKIRIDGKVRGKAPLTWTNCRRGKHKLVIKHPFFLPVKKKIRCKRRKITKIKIKLKDLRWVVNVKSKPPKLNVLIDGKKTCVTPCRVTNSLRKPFKVEVQSGNKKLRNLGLSWSETLSMKPSKSKTLNVKIPYGILDISEEPESGEFSLAPLGVIDAQSIVLPPGKFTLKVQEFSETKFPEWENKTITILGDGSTTTVDPPTFGAAPGRLNMNSRPTGATILIDGTKIGVTPIENHRLKSGAHTVDVCKRGYRPRQFPVNLNAGDQLQIDAVELAPYSLWDRIPGGAITAVSSGVTWAIGSGLVGYAGALKTEYSDLWSAGAGYEQQESLAEQHSRIYPIALATFGIGALGTGFSAYRVMMGATPEGSASCGK